MGIVLGTYTYQHVAQHVPTIQLIHNYILTLLSTVLVKSLYQWQHSLLVDQMHPNPLGEEPGQVCARVSTCSTMQKTKDNSYDDY